MSCDCVYNKYIPIDETKDILWTAQSFNENRVVGIFTDKEKAIKFAISENSKYGVIIPCRFDLEQIGNTIIVGKYIVFGEEI